MKKPKKKIVQICPPATPLFAVYSDSGDGGPPSAKEHLSLVPCPVVGLIEVENEEARVVGLVVEDWGLDEPIASNFLGYATSEKDAEQYVAK